VLHTPAGTTSPAEEILFHRAGPSSRKKKELSTMPGVLLSSDAAIGPTKFQPSHLQYTLEELAAMGSSGHSQLHQRAAGERRFD
jgi:hypothetical protein